MIWVLEPTVDLYLPDHIRAWYRAPDSKSLNLFVTPPAGKADRFARQDQMSVFAEQHPQPLIAGLTRIG